VSGFYYDYLEPGGFRHQSPMDPAALSKFDEAPDISRVFDSGEITIYRVEEQRAVP
jgi:hypothetical protein